MSKFYFHFKVILLLVCVSIFSVGGCGVAAKNKDEAASADKGGTAEQPLAAAEKPMPKGFIKIQEGGPADAVRIFYKNLRERRFRDAMMMTNLRIAIEGLTDAEMDDLKSDFEPLAAKVPETTQINGEIISGDTAIVKAKLPNDDGFLQQTDLNLRRENGQWVLLIAPDDAEQAAKKEGKNYFFTLRFETHHTEAQNMMERISKAETLNAIQNGGTFAEIPALVQQGLLPPDVTSAASTGYTYKVTLQSGGKKYYATAEPEVYGRTGKLSFLMECDGPDKPARLKSEDNKGKPLKN